MMKRDRITQLVSLLLFVGLFADFLSSRGTSLISVSIEYIYYVYAAIATIAALSATIRTPGA